MTTTMIGRQQWSGGAGVATIKNANGVVVNLRATLRGVKFKLGADGVKFKLD